MEHEQEDQARGTPERAGLPSAVVDVSLIEGFGLTAICNAVADIRKRSWDILICVRRLHRCAARHTQACVHNTSAYASSIATMHTSPRTYRLARCLLLSAYPFQSRQRPLSRWSVMPPCSHHSRVE